MKPIHSPAKARRARLALVLAFAALLSLPIAASAIHWPNFGGDAGHSGNQILRAAEMGIEYKYRHVDPGVVRTSIVTSGGDDVSGQRVGYGKFVDVSGTANDQTRVHILDLATGAEKVPDAQQNIDDDSDGDGDEAGSDDRALGIGDQFVTPVSSSGHGSLGQMYVVHNDEDSQAADDNGCNPLSNSDASDNDIAIAQFDEATGEQKADFAVGQAQGSPPDPTCGAKDQPSDGFSIESSPVITPPLDAEGRRWLFFVAKNDAGGSGRLFRVEINNAGAPTAAIGFTTPSVRDIPNLNSKASPSIAYFEDPSTGFVIPYVVVAINAAGGASDIRAFKAADISDVTEIDLEVPADIPGNPQTISVPVSEDGELPGPLSGDEKAPAIYAAYHETGPSVSADDDETRVYRFTQTGNDEELEPTVVTPPALDGAPGPGLALSTFVSGSEEQTDCAAELQCVVVTTGENLFVLDPMTGEPVERLRDSGESLLQPNIGGFARNVPLTSGGYVFVQDDGGIPYVLDLDDAERVSSQDFVPELTAHLESDRGLGQPSYSNGHLQYLTDRGLFVYNTGIFFPPNSPPVARFTASPNPANVNQAVTFDATGSNDPDDRPLTYEWDFDGDGTFEVNRGNDPKITVSFPVPRTYDVTLRVTDEPLERTAAQSDTTTVPVVIGSGPPNVPPTASFTATPNPAATSRQVVFDASASRDSDGSIVRYEWDLDGNGSYETNSGSNPRTQRSYSTPAVYNVKLRVTDNAGSPAETTRQVTVTRSGASAARKTPRSLSATTRPTRDRALPYRFRTSGRLRLPSGVKRSDGCNGRVKVTIKVGKKTISSRTARLSRRCTYSKRVTFRDRTRLGKATRLRVIVRFQGNKVLKPKSARTRRVRIG